MKITTLFIFCFVFSLSATVYAQKKKISINEQNTTILNVLKNIENNSEFVFFFNDNQIDVTQQININVKDATLAEVLNQLLTPANYNYKIIDRQVLITKAKTRAKVAGLIAQQNDKRITGTIVDSNGVPIIGANVVEEGTTNGTITDLDGKFILTLKKGANLLVSYIGYSEQKIATAGKSSIQIILKEDSELLDEVVVVGYGVAKKSTLTGSVSLTRGDEIIKAPVTNVSNALAGQLPGLSTTQESGEPGQDGSTIRIRGVNTIGDNSALIVIDGIPGRSLDRIDPQSIESITVLKDASAAIYGSQAANGVILVTTKRGKIGKPELSISYNQGFNQPTKIPEMSNSFEYATMLNELNSYRNIKPYYTSEELTKFADGSDPLHYPNTDWFAEALRTWSTQNYLNATLRGGNEKWKYFISLGSKYQDGYYKNSSTNYKQYNFRSNIDGEISKNVKLFFDISGRLEDQNNSTREAGSIYRMLVRGKPNMISFWPNGEAGPDMEYGDNPCVIGTDATGYDRNKNYVLNTNLKLDINIPWIKGLSFTTNASYDKDIIFRKRFETPWFLYSWDGTSLDANNQPALLKGKKGYSDPRLHEWMYDNQSILLNGLFNYSTQIQKHGIKGMVGMEYRTGSGDEFDAFRRYYVSSVLDELFAGGNKDKDNSGSSFENARLNYFGRLNYNYDEKYLVEFVFRLDGSYIFPKEGRYGFFPGISLGWRASEETFWKENIPFIEDLKIRGSWGSTGNDRIAEWQYLATYRMSPYSYMLGENIENNLLIENQIPNKKVTWEVAHQANIGFDAQFLDHTLSFSLDGFYNKRSDILWKRNASVPSTTGLTLPRENIGTVVNKGLDFNLSYHNQINKLNYQISFNGGYAKNKITFWDESPGRPSYQMSTEKPIPSNVNDIDSDLYYQAIGIFKDEAAVEAYPHWKGARSGDIIFEDYNNDNKIDANDRVRSNKNQIPRFTGGLNIRLAYSCFDLSLLFQGQAGAERYIQTESGEVGNFLKSDFEKRWTEDNPNSEGPRAWNANTEYWITQPNTYFLHKTDFIRLKNLELGYTLDVKEIAKMRFYLSGYNLFTIAPDMKDFDPEVSNTRGISYPIQRVMNIGLSVTF